MKRILIADDSATARMFIRRCVEISGIESPEILEAINGKEALSIMREQQVDILFTDINMPEMDGEELLKRVQASPKLNATFVVVITSADSKDREQRLLEMGAKAVLSKPVSPPKIAEVLTDFIDKEDEW